MSDRQETTCWQPIETAPRARHPMIVVRAFGVPAGTGAIRNYHSDPYCVWWDEDDACWRRWPHAFPPTHWTTLPGPPHA